MIAVTGLAPLAVSGWKLGTNSPAPGARLAPIARLLLDELDEGHPMAFLGLEIAMVPAMVMLRT